jgi:hypothetical protein
MAEKVKKSKLSLGSDGPSVPVDEGDGKQVAANVDVIHGVYAHSMPFAGMKVKQARKELANKMNIDPTAVAVVDGVEVDDDTILTEGNCLTFVKPAGEKGVSHYGIRTYDKVIFMDFSC